MKYEYDFSCRCNKSFKEIFLATPHRNTVVKCTCGQLFRYDEKLDYFLIVDVKDIAQQPHYTQWKIQPITFITANKLNFCQGNVIKYVMRYKEKNGGEDLRKAKVYIDYLIQELETGEVKP